MMMSKEPTIIELDMDELQEILRRAEAKQFSDKDYETARTVLLSYVQLVDLLKGKNVSIRRLQKMLFGASTEKMAAVIDGETEAPPLHDEDATAGSPGEADAESASEDDPSTGAKGHGRNGADAYCGAEQIEVPHESLRPGDACPDCEQGTVYEVSRPGVLVRISGQAPVQAKVYRLQKLRCNLCGKVFTAQAPEGVGSRK
jgi:transposase